MTEDMLQCIVRRQADGLPTALTTIIRTRGSTPCKAGTKMLVFPDGHTYGTIGGGCAEAEVKLKALTAFDDGTPCTASVLLINDDAAKDGMICGGSMDVFIQII